MFREQVKALAARALDGGAKQNTPFEVEWDVSGDCLAPVRREVFARHAQEWKRLSFQTWDSVEATFDNGPGQAVKHPVTYFREIGPYAVLLTVRCRKCDACLRIRTRTWAARACAEIAFAPRTWMATLTLSPESQYRFQAMTADRLGRRGVDFYRLDGNTQLVERHNTIQREITLMFKRMRKDGMSFRYLLVLEAHKSGLPHYHLLIHEQGEPIRHARLASLWRYGYSRFKLVDNDERGKAAWYAAKYLSKSAAARVRASLRYGSPKLGSRPPIGKGLRETVTKSDHTRKKLFF